MAVTLNQILENTEIDSAGCMNWKGAKSKAGYGQKGVNYKVLYTHRIVATLVYGEPIDKLEVLHSCDNRACCNPKHLSWGTRKENVADMIAKGRQVINPAKGEKHGMSKLNEQQVEEIRNLRKQGFLLKELASMFDCTIANIHLITSNKHWKGNNG